MKYRELANYRNGIKDVLGVIKLNDGVVEYEDISPLRIEQWERDGVSVGGRVFLPKEAPELFFNLLQLNNTSYIKAGPIYYEGEE